MGCSSYQKSIWLEFIEIHMPTLCYQNTEIPYGAGHPTLQFFFLQDQLLTVTMCSWLMETYQESTLFNQILTINFQHAV